MTRSTSSSWPPLVFSGGKPMIRFGLRVDADLPGNLTRWVLVDNHWRHERPLSARDALACMEIEVLCSRSSTPEDKETPVLWPRLRSAS